MGSCSKKADSDGILGKLVRKFIAVSATVEEDVKLCSLGIQLIKILNLSFCTEQKVKWSLPILYLFGVQIYCGVMLCVGEIKTLNKYKS